VVIHGLRRAAYRGGSQALTPAITEGNNDWTLATGNGSVGANTMTNQLGELFYNGLR